MTTPTCPDCGATLDSGADRVICGHCQGSFQILALCPDCGHPLERLRACGAVNYFCQHCNALISKSRIQFEAQR